MAAALRASPDGPTIVTAPLEANRAQESNSLSPRRPFEKFRKESDMKFHRNALLACAAALAFCGASTAADLPDNWDGLVRVKPKRMDAAWVAPGADFRTYTKVMLDPADVAFKKNWLRDLNNDTTGTSRDLSQEDADKILAAARDGLDQVFREAFEKAGIPVVTTPGSDVLRLSPGVGNLDIAAPDTMSAGMSRTYVTESGEATLVLEARDSTSGALLGRVVDRRETRQAGRAQWATSVSNRADFEQLFRSWANIAIKGLGELKEHSPVPEDLQPNQKLN
jgi:hypothetical protein